MNYITVKVMFDNECGYYTCIYKTNDICLVTEAKTLDRLSDRFSELYKDVMITTKVPSIQFKKCTYAEFFAD